MDYASYSDQNKNKNGGFIGASASFYRGNLFSAWTISTGASTGDANSAFGKEEISLLTALQVLLIKQVITLNFLMVS